MIRIAGYTALVLATLAILYLAWQFNRALVLFLLSLAAAAAFRPLEDALRRRGLRRRIAMLLSYAIVLAALAILILVASGPMISDLQQATNDGLVAYEGLRASLGRSQLAPSDQLTGWLPSTQAIYAALTGEESGQAFQAIFGAAEGTLDLLAHLAIVLILSLYWSSDQVRFERLWLSLLPVNQRARARNIWHEIESDVGATIAREVTLSVLCGVALWLGYLALGIKYGTLLAALAAIAHLIPWLGPALIVFASFSLGLGQSLLLALTAAGYSTLVLVLLRSILGARLFPRPRYNPLLLVTFVIAMADSFSLVGVILAPILTVAVQILLSNLLLVYSAHTGECAENTLHNLQSRLGDIRRLADDQQSAGAVPANLISRLDRLITKAQQFYSID